MRTICNFGVGVCALIAAAGVAQGAAFDLDNTGAPAPFSVGANDFEFGLSINGNPFQTGLSAPANGTFPHGTLTFAGRFIDLGATPASTRTVYFIDPSLTVLDILTYTFTPAGDFFSVNMTGTFTSDPSGGLGGVPGGTNPADVWPVGTDFVWSTTGFGGVVRTAIPTPGAAGLLAVGGLVAIRRRRAR